MAQAGGKVNYLTAC